MTTQSTIDKLIEMRRMHGTHRRAETSGGVGILRFAQDVPAVIVGIGPRLSRRLIVLAHELVEAVVGIGHCVLAIRDGRDVPARVVGIGIRRRAGLPRPDLPRGRRGRGIVIADRGLDHGLSAALRVHRGHPPQRVVGVARGDGSLRRFRQAVVRSSLEYLRAILFSRTDNSHILTKETTMCQHALPLLYHVTCQEHPETPLCVGIIPTFHSSFIAKLQYSSS